MKSFRICFRTFYFVLFFLILSSSNLVVAGSSNIGIYTLSSCSSITLVRQPTSFDAWTGYSGTANNFSVYATSTGGALSYQWERSTDEGQTWTSVTASLDAGTTYSGFNAATIYYTNTAGSITSLNGYKYRVKVSNSTCFVYSNEVTLRVFGPSFFPSLNLPATTNYCSSSPTLSVEFSASPNSSITAFAWERRIGSGGTWVPITASNANTLDAGMSYTNFNRAACTNYGCNYCC